MTFTGQNRPFALFSIAVVGGLVLASGCVALPSSGADPGCPSDGLLRIKALNGTPENVTAQPIGADIESDVLRTTLDSALTSRNVSVHSLTPRQTSTIDRDLSDVDWHTGQARSGWYVRYENSTLRAQLWCEG